MPHGLLIQNIADWDLLIRHENMIRSTLNSVVLLSLGLTASLQAQSAEFAWPMKEKEYKFCAGGGLNLQDCTIGPQTKEFLKEPYRQVVRVIDSLTSGASPDDISSALGIQPLRPGRLHTYRVNQKQLTSMNVQWVLPMTPEEMRDGVQRIERGLAASYIDGILIDVIVIEHPNWVFRVKYSDTKCMFNCPPAKTNGNQAQ